jgi:hypothetical protein
MQMPAIIKTMREFYSGFVIRMELRMGATGAILFMTSDGESIWGMERLGGPMGFTGRMSP